MIERLKLNHLGRELRAVTFDCWGTLIYESDPERTFEMRSVAFFELLMEAGAEATLEEAITALNNAWTRHAQCWAKEISTGSLEVALWALQSFDIYDSRYHQRLVDILEATPKYHGVKVLDGAEQTLEKLRELDIRRGLICDTGLVSAKVVRELLSSVNLIEALETLVFSDEIGVPKPNLRMFQTALYGLKTSPEYAVHVGDLKRTDVAGARNVGMASVRIRWRYDDQSDFPEADVVVDSHYHLQDVLGI